MKMFSRNSFARSFLLGVTSIAGFALLLAAFFPYVQPAQAFGNPADQVIDVEVSCEQEAHRNAVGEIFEWEIRANANAEGAHPNATVDVAIGLNSGSGSGSASVTVIVPGAVLAPWSAYASTREEPGLAGSGSSCQGSGGGQEAAPDQTPKGNFEAVTCATISGWAFDPDAPNDSINVDIYRNGPVGQGSFVGRFLANQPRPDVNAAFGISGNHGFTIPTPDVFKNGQTHQVYIYGINATAGSENTLLSGSPKPITCPVTPPCPTGFRVVAESYTVEVGKTTRVFAPSGWVGGNFSGPSDKVSIAPVSTGSNFAVVTAVGAGLAEISGSGWTTSVGANGCGLEPTTISVVPSVNTGTLSAPNISVCEPNVSGITTVTATASTFAEIRVYNSNLADGFVFATVPANGQIVRETGSWVKNGTEFRLVTPLASGVELAHVAVVVTQRPCPNAPTVDIKANGSDGPVTVVTGGSVVVSWQSQNATQCEAESEWTTNTAVAGQESVVVGRRTVFGIVCTGPGGRARDVVEVLVTPTPPVLPPLVDAWVYNGATAPAGLAPACNQIAAVWTKSERAVSGYRVYYYNPDTATWVRLVDIPNAQLQPYGERYQTVFAAPSTTVALRYRVYTYLDSVEYVATRDASGSPLLPVPCGGSANLAPSNKDIVKIRSINLCAVGVCNPYNDQDSPVKPALPVSEGDAVTFAINLVNGGSEPIAGPISISDVLTNMTEPKNGFQITAACSNQCSVNVDGYTAATKTIRMTVTPIGKNTLAGGSQEVWTISLTAETKAPNNKQGQPFRFRNQAFVNGVTGPLLTTPYILVLPVGTPTIEEIQ